MLWPACLPVRLRDEGLVHDLRGALPNLLRAKGRQPDTAVLFDMDHTEGTYAAVELLCQRFDRVALVTPPESIAQDVPLVSRQSIYRRFHRLPVELRLLSELHLGERFDPEGVVETVSVYGGEPVVIDDVAFIAYATPRELEDALLELLRARGLPVFMAWACIRPGPLMAATAQGNEAGRAVRRQQAASGAPATSPGTSPSPAHRPAGPRRRLTAPRGRSPARRRDQPGAATPRRPYDHRFPPCRSAERQDNRRRRRESSSGGSDVVR